MSLTAKREKFAQCIADGMTQADAYREAYSTANMKPSTVQENASRLMADSKVSARVVELCEQLASKRLWTREESTAFYRSVLADNTGEFKGSDKINAAKQMDKTHGFELVRLDHTTNGESMQPTRIEIVAPSVEKQ